MKPRSSSVAALVIVLLLGTVGCGADATVLGTWWWPSLDPADTAQTGLDGGRGFPVQGFAVRQETTSDPSRNLLGVMLVGSDTAVSCAAYSGYLNSLADTQRWFDIVWPMDDPARPTNAQILGYVCQEIQSASREAFGGNGAYRALHLLLDISGGGPASGEFRAATKGAAADELGGAELLSPSTYVARLYERSVHGEGLLPARGEFGNAGDFDPLASCPAILSSLLDNNSHLPDPDVPALNAAAHRYYHHYESQDSLPFMRADDSEIEVVNAVWSGEYAQLAEIGGNLSPTAFLEVAGAVDAFPYDKLLLSTQANRIPIEACPSLGDSFGFVWSEVPELGWSTAGDSPGDDDDSSSGDDDDSAAN